MKATLYEALGIPQNAPVEEVRAALRRLIRKYYAKTRDGQGNVEEALRFINHASRILSDPERRARYDNELALSAGTTEQRIAHVVTQVVADSGAKVRNAPSTKAALLGKVPKGVVVKIKSCRRIGKYQWFEITYHQGRKEGWTREDNLQF